MSGVQIIFLLVAIVGLLAALGTVLVRNLVHAALCLIGFFFTIACQFLLLEAEFLAAMQVLVYIGAVSILILFGIMLTRNIRGDETTFGQSGWKLLSGLVSLGFLVILIFGVTNERGSRSQPAWSEVKERPGGLNPAVDGESEIGLIISDMPTTLGRELMTRYLLPFELVGLLLTAALVGAIVLARAEPGTNASNHERATETEPKEPADGHE